MLEERQVELLLLAEVRIEERVDAEEQLLERVRVGDVHGLERVHVFAEENVVELHDRRRARMAQAVRDTRIEPELLGLGMQLEAVAQEDEHVLDLVAPALIRQLRNAARDVDDLGQARPKLVVVSAQRFGERPFHVARRSLARDARASARVLIRYGGFPVRVRCLGPDASWRLEIDDSAMAEWLNGSDAGPDARVAIVGWEQQANRDLTRELRRRGVRASLLTPSQALAVLDCGDVAIGRIDVLPTLDGVEPGLDCLTELAERKVRVVNSAESLLNAHDKLRTAECLWNANVPHPHSIHARHLEELWKLPLPVVVKPRFGSWGADVFRCTVSTELEALVPALRARPWFAEHGALVQELVPNAGRDLRLLVANGELVGATERRARAGEWRTNVSLGGTRHPLSPPPAACSLALEAVDALDIDFAGVDLLPTRQGFVVLEINGAVEFDNAYDLVGSNVYTALLRALDLPQRHLSLA